MRRGIGRTWWCVAGLVVTLNSANGDEISFNRDIRPILSDACFHCHGPDKNKRKGSLNLDTEEGARADLGDHFAVVPGKPAESELVRRITSTDAKKRMPPSGSALSPEQIQTLTRWIREGAKYERHWAFIPPQKAPLPIIRDRQEVRNVIDAFVLSRLEKEKLKPSPEADRTTLLRRLSFDLTGLPPTPEEVDAFVADLSPNAYEKVVDRLLKSPRYGERMAQRWLDGARYADTNGYQTDGDRSMWRWRDWVIEAFNANKPFDRFTLEQIAGDMLPNPTLEQRIATGFNRNHRGNSEGGVIPEEYAVEYVVDRVDTTSTVWLGLTMGCTRCHNHKYDPFTQKDFYQLFAYFNNVPERGKAIKYGNSPPWIKAPTREQQKHLRMLESQGAVAGKRWRDVQPELESAQTKWESEAKGKPGESWEYSKGLLTSWSGASVKGTGSPTPTREHEAVKSASADLGDVGAFGFFDKFTFGVWVHAEIGQDGPLFSRTGETERGEGYSVTLEGGKVQVNLVKRWLDDAIRVETEKPVALGKWSHVAISYDGSRQASGVRVFVDGELVKLKVKLDDLNQSFATKAPLRVGAGGGSRFTGSLANFRVYDHVIPPLDIASLASAADITALLAKDSRDRKPGEKHKLRTYFLERHAPDSIRHAYLGYDRAAKELADFDASLPTTMVMEEMPTPRPTHLLLRGEYDKPGPRVQPAPLESLAKLPANAPNNRLGFAQWLVAADNPLPARVTVNRVWQMFFGAGIVKTVEDFGSQGDWPSHPELLDWLAVDFRDHGWDLHHLIRTIVTSSTYRQSSKVTPLLAQRDPENRLLARGPRFRLSAEMIRDQALAASGLLVEKVGGPSVRPYQPAGLQKELHGTEEYEQDHGANLYRRSLYTYWKRTVAPPTLMTFDAANRETCVVRETRTNTPLQALNLMNDVTFVEASRVLAQGVMADKQDLDDRLALAFRRLLARTPTEREKIVLRSAWYSHRNHFQKTPERAEAFVKVGEFPLPTTYDAVELASFTAVASTLMNLDESITKE